MELQNSGQIGEILFDSHTHLLDYPKQQLPLLIKRAQQNWVYFISANTTCQQQYQPMQELSNLYPPQIIKEIELSSISQQNRTVTIVPSFGIHPCFIQRQSQHKDWYDTLKGIVLKNQLYGIGEIGLDYRTATLETNSKQVQHYFFTKQFELALQLNRPVTVHCVRAHGQMLKIFKNYNKILEEREKNKKLIQNSISETIQKQSNSSKQLINKYTPIIMHSYGGSKQITKSLLKLKYLNFYFSLCLKRSEDLCTVIPLDRLLLETDSPYQSHPPLLFSEKILNPADFNQQDIQLLQKTNKIQYVRANLSLCKYYNLSKDSFSKAILSNSLKVFKLLL